MSQEQEILEPGIKTPPKKCGCLRGCLLYGGLFLLIAAFPVWWFCVRTPPLRISKETTYLTGPLAADDWRIDYFRAWEEHAYPPEMKTEENGYRLIVRACGDLANRTGMRLDPRTGEWSEKTVDRELYRLQVYEKLGLDPAIPPTLKLEAPDTFLARLAKEEDTALEKIVETEPGVFQIPPEMMEQPHPPTSQDIYFQLPEKQGRSWWTFEDIPALRQWYEENNAALDLLTEAVRKPVFYVPYVRSSPEKLNIPDFGAETIMEREWARALTARANYRIGVGEIDGAIEDVLTIYRLARHAGHQGVWISYQIANALESIAESIEIGANPAAPPSREQLKRLLRGIETLPPPVPFREMFEAARYSDLSFFQALAYGKNPYEDFDLDIEFEWPVILKILSVDWNVVLERVNEKFDRLDDELVSNKRIDFNNEYRGWVSQSLCLLLTDRRSDLVARGLTDRIVSASALQEVENRRTCSDNLKRLTLALLLYEKDHGRLPGEDVDWREAVKPYLGPEPEKIFRCPSHPSAGDVATYAMIAGVGNPNPGPNQILLVEVVQPQKFGEGNGRIPREKARFWHDLEKPDESRPDDFDGLGGYHYVDVFAGFRSGAVLDLFNATEPEKLKVLIEGTPPAKRE